MSDFIKEGHRDELFIIGKIWNDAHRPQLARCAIATKTSQVMHNPLLAHTSSKRSFWVGLPCCLLVSTLPQTMPKTTNQHQGTFAGYQIHISDVESVGVKQLVAIS